MKPYQFYKLLSESDTHLFTNELVKLGFDFHETDRSAIATEISEDVNEIEELPPELDAIKALARALGFIVTYNMRD